jgi:uncharacterized DUF497 family protein
MINWSRIEGFDWDAGNEAKLLGSGRNISKGEVEELFGNAPLIVSADVGHSATEPRFHALGKTDRERRLLVVFTLRANETLIRPISPRDMSRKERNHYEQHQA